MSEHKKKLPVEILLTQSRWTKRYHLRIVGGNHKIRFHGENYFSHGNAVRAAEDAAKDLGITWREVR